MDSAGFCSFSKSRVLCMMEEGVETFSKDSSRLSASAQSRSMGKADTKLEMEPGLPTPGSVPLSEERDTEWKELTEDAGAWLRRIASETANLGG